MQRPPARRVARRAGARARDRRRRGSAVPVSRRGVGARGPQAPGRRAPARCARARVRARGLPWGRGPGARDFPLWKRSRAGGSGEKRSAVAALQPRPRGQAPGQRLRERCAWRGACRPPTRALLPRWAATLNLIWSQEPGDHQRLSPGGKAGFCFAVI